MAVFGPGWRDQVHRVTNNHACIGVFSNPGGGTVFNAGVTDWTCGLGDPDVDASRGTCSIASRRSQLCDGSAREVCPYTSWLYV